ncbi:glycerophosphodiester phosphodiesterase family protein [Halovulum sp. GXIMD14793]
MPDLPDAFLTTPLAHRGFHDQAAGIIENSASAFRAAIDAGYGIECDIQRSADGDAMVFHDYDLARLTGQSGPVVQRTTEALQNTILSGSRDTIPTLTEVLQLVAGQVPLLIEIKDQDGALGSAVGPLEQAVANALKDYVGGVAVMSFNPHSIDAFSRYAPDVPVGLTTCAFDAESWGLIPAQRRAELAGIPDLDRLNCCFISHDHRHLTSHAVQALKTCGVPLLSWTICSKAEETAARTIADNITFEGYAPAH